MAWKLLTKKEADRLYNTEPAYLYAWTLGEAYAKATSEKGGDTEAYARSNDKVNKTSTNATKNSEKHVSEASTKDPKPSGQSKSQKDSISVNETIP